MDLDDEEEEEEEEEKHASHPSSSSQQNGRSSSSIVFFWSNSYSSLYSNLAWSTAQQKLDELQTEASGLKVENAGLSL